MHKRGAKVAIFASGEGTNAERLIRRTHSASNVEIVLVAGNRPEAGALVRASRLGITTWAFSKGDLDGGEVTRRLEEMGVDFVALAGFLLKVPSSLLSAYGGQILNLHPSLLPAFGGRGMYGRHVHQAVFEALQEQKVSETGITMHWVDAEYDTGPVFFHKATPLTSGDTAASIANKIQALEEAHYAEEALRAIRESLSLSQKMSEKTSA